MLPVLVWSAAAAAAATTGGLAVQVLASLLLLVVLVLIWSGGGAGSGGLVLLVLFSTFGRMSEALLILCNIPFALIGGVLALWISGEYLSVPASVGFIALLGVAVMNGVVLISYVRKLETDEGLEPEDAAQRGALTRMRPVLMTAMVAALGFVPMAIATGSGAEVQRPLATVVIGGLVTSTFLTLFVLPSIYPWFTSPEDGGAADEHGGG